MTSSFGAYSVMPVRSRGGQAARRLHRAQHAELGAVAADQQRLARLRPRRRQRRRCRPRPRGAQTGISEASTTSSARVMRSGRRRSTQRRNTLCGLSSQSGSKAVLIRRCWSSSCAAELHAHQVALLHADAMLAGQAAADLDAELQDVGAELSRRVEAGRVVGVEHDQRMQVAVAGMEDVGDLQPVSVATSRRCGAARRAGVTWGSRRPCTDSPG